MSDPAPLTTTYEPTEREKRALGTMRAKIEDGRPRPKLKISKPKRKPPQLEVNHPDHGTGWALAMSSLGVDDPDLATALIQQLADLSHQKGHLTEENLNASLALVQGVAPNDPVEAMLAFQMAAVHNATMVMARRLRGCETIQQQDSASNALNKLARTFAAQIEALKRYRSKGEQKMTVEHVHVHEGGQAIVGNVDAGGGVRR